MMFVYNNGDYMKNLGLILTQFITFLLEIINQNKKTDTKGRVVLFFFLLIKDNKYCQ